MAEKKLYECTLDGYFLGDYYKAGVRRRFHPEQVENDLHRWKPVDPQAEAVAASHAAAPASPAPAARRSSGRRAAE